MRVATRSDEAGQDQDRWADTTELSVLQLVQIGRTAVEDVSRGRLAVRGELSGWKRAVSGHCYWTLRDARAQISAVMYRSHAARLPAEPVDGIEVVAVGRLSVYAPYGRLQLVTEQLTGGGEDGFWRLAREGVLAELAAEGLLSLARKRRLPRYADRVGLVTSVGSAAYADVLQGIQRRSPWVDVHCAHTRVEGPGAAEEIADQIGRLGRSGLVQLLILARGGGGPEALSAFDSAVVARAIARCPVPVVVGVGHETDSTVADAVADVRAPTPTGAAELALPDREQVAAALVQMVDQVRRGVLGCTDAAVQVVGRTVEHLTHSAELRLRIAEARLAGVRPSQLRRALHALVRRQDQLLRTAGLPVLRGRIERILAGGDAILARAGLSRLRLAAQEALARQDRRLGAGSAHLEALSPLGTLARGYAVAEGPAGAILRSVRQVAVGDSIRVRLRDGSLSTRVEALRPEPTL